MSLSTRIAPHLPYLRRFSRAVTGSQTSGDAYVAATLEALIADLSIFPEGEQRSHCALQAVLEAVLLVRPCVSPSPFPAFLGSKRAAAQPRQPAPKPRQAFLLVAVEGFSHARRPPKSSM
jgi:hypothetical protein